MLMQSEQDDDAREAWVLRAGAELWKAVVAEGSSPAEDTQKALAAVRFALDSARRLRCAGDVPEHEHAHLAAQAAQAATVQLLALQQWGRGRGLNWEADWGMQWGEMLSDESQPSPENKPPAENTSSSGDTSLSDPTHTPAANQSGVLSRL